MVHFHKRLTPEILADINEMVIQEAISKRKDKNSKDGKDNTDSKDDNSSNNKNGENSENIENSENSVTMIVDATCAHSNIRYSQDVSLLNEVREKAKTYLRYLRPKRRQEASYIP